MRGTRRSELLSADGLFGALGPADHETADPLPARYESGSLLVRFRDPTSHKPGAVPTVGRGTAAATQPLLTGSKIVRDFAPRSRLARKCNCHPKSTWRPPWPPIAPIRTCSMPNRTISSMQPISRTTSQYSDLWGLNNTGQTGGTVDADIDAPAAWDVTTGSSSTLVAVIDTGVDYTHEDLAANIWVNPGEIAGDGIDNDGNGYVDDVHGYDFANDDGDPMDDHDHGTHVAGTIGAVADNGTWRQRSQLERPDHGAQVPGRRWQWYDK